jgi:hypothetical protein
VSQLDLAWTRMSDFVTDPTTLPTTETPAAALYLWRGGGIVLFGEHEAGRWVLARGWLEGDRLEHVRRWSFAQPIPFSGQVRRLVMEASHDLTLARAEGLRALAWTEAVS